MVDIEVVYFEAFVDNPRAARHPDHQTRSSGRAYNDDDAAADDSRVGSDLIDIRLIERRSSDS